MKERLIEKLKEIYIEIRVQVMINREEIKGGVRQGCPISSDLFNTAIRSEERWKVLGAGTNFVKERIKENNIIHGEKMTRLSSYLYWMVKQAFLMLI